MQITSRFTVAVHALTCVEFFKGRETVTSSFIAASAGANPVVVRMVMSDLKAAGLIITSRGKCGIELARPSQSITLYDVYKAVGGADKDGLFHFHKNPCPACPVGRTIHAALDERLRAAQQAMEDELRRSTLADVMDGIAAAAKD